MALLEFAGVTKRFRRADSEIEVLHGVSFGVQEGEVVALMGPSGSGKSTALHLAGGLDLADDGRVRFAGSDLAASTHSARARMRRRQIGFVFQFFHLVPTLSVAENVGLPLFLDRRDAKRPVTTLLEALGLRDRAAHRPSQLSGGEMQRVAIARALVTRPRLLLADEPTGNLDSATGEATLDLMLSTARACEAGVLLVTHDPSVADRADRVLHLRDGRLGEQHAPSPRLMAIPTA